MNRKRKKSAPISERTTAPKPDPSANSGQALEEYGDLWEMNLKRKEDHPN
jgi:hypothetical protein